MTDKTSLRDFCADALRFFERQPDVKQAEVFASKNRLDVLRLSLCSNVPSNGLEETKEHHFSGYSVRLLFSNKKNGFAKTDTDFSRSTFDKTLELARRNAVADPDFKSLPAPSKQKPRFKPVVDCALVELDFPKAMDAGWNTLETAASDLLNHASAFNITGEIDFSFSQMGVANSLGIRASESNTGCVAHLTVIKEGETDRSGVAQTSGTRLKKLDVSAMAQTATQNALAHQNPSRIDSGAYDVIFSPNAVADLLVHLFDPNLSSVDIGASPLSLKDKGKKLGSPLVSITDDPHLPDSIASRAHSDEGIPTKPQRLIDKGRFARFVSDDYYSSKHPAARAFNGNGFRHSGLSRHHGTSPGAETTNLVIASGKTSDETILAGIKRGVYVGRIWYTYPVNGSTKFDFTSTIRGDSWIIQNGRKTQALVPNTVRINDNLQTLLQHVFAVGTNPQTITVWGNDTVVHSPVLAVQNVRLDRISKGIY